MDCFNEHEKLGGEMSFRYSKRDIAKTIDHSLLKPEMTREEVAAGCAIAEGHRCRDWNSHRISSWIINYCGKSF
jgi:deoxyribose-phosphate aldolase